MYCINNNVMGKTQRLGNSLWVCLHVWDGGRDARSLPVSISICDADCTVETHTESVADGQTALEFGVYMDIYIYTNMPGAAVCPCVSLEKYGRQGCLGQ